MSSDKIAAELRTEFGKGAARRIRRDHKIPAVIYGHGNDPIHVTLPGHDTMMAIKHGGANALLELEVDGKAQLALTKQVVVHPIKRNIEHADLIVVKRGEKVTVDVNVVVEGDAAQGRGEAGERRIRSGQDARAQPVGGLADRRRNHPPGGRRGSPP